MFKIISFFLLLIFFFLTAQAQLFFPFSFWSCKSTNPFSDITAAHFSAGSMSNVNFNGTAIVLNAAQTNGSFTSRVIDTYSQCGLNYIRYLWFSTLPAGKELAPSLETGYAGNPTDFSTGLVAYWKLNESGATAGADNDFFDSSGNSNYGEMVGTLTYGAAGKLNKAITMNGAAANYIDVNDAVSLDGSNQMTFSFWMYPTTVDAQPRAVLSKRIDSGAANLAYGFFLYTSNKLAIDLDTTNNRFLTNKVFTTNTWYHVVIVYDGTLALASRAKVYVDGVLDTTTSETSTTLPNSSANAAIGFMGAQTVGFAGKIDEVAIWRGRSLTAAQVLELYLRGANRLLFQIRTCTLADCSDNPGWQGPDGTSSTYFSEINNNTIAASGGGTVKAASPIMNFSDFPMLLLLSYRYFQYRAFFETDNTSYSPALRSTEITR